GFLVLSLPGDLALATDTKMSGQLRAGRGLLEILLLFSTLGCSHERYGCQTGLAQRILPPMNLDIHEELPTPKQETPTGSPTQFAQPKVADDTNAKEVKLSAPAQGSGVTSEPGQPLTLAEAIDTAFRQQPRLRVYLESIEQAWRGEDIAFAPFL